MMLEPGSVVGPVRLARLVRKASTHQLYEGRHLRLGVDVMLRLVPACPGSDDSFLGDARIAADARHPALVPVIDFGEYGDLRYVVTARAHGKTLEQHLTEHEAPLPERVIVRVLTRVAEALEVLHAAGLAHGNIRPSSLVMDARGQLRVTDLSFAAEGGASSALHASVDERSLYCPPEAASPVESEGGLDAASHESSAAARSDLYALGVIAYESIFRRMPYAPSAGAAPMSGAPIEPARFDAPTDCSARLLAVVERLIAPDPRQRIASAEELLEVLPAEPEASLPAASPAAKPAAQAQAHDSELVSILEFLQRRFGSRKTQQAEGPIVHSSLRERSIVWLLLALLLGATVAALRAG